MTSAAPSAATATAWPSRGPNGARATARRQNQASSSSRAAVHTSADDPPPAPLAKPPTITSDASSRATTRCDRRGAHRAPRERTGAAGASIVCGCVALRVSGSRRTAGSSLENEDLFQGAT
jgi:hypothetical protein